MADRLYDQMLARLSQRLDPEVFERCMADLLRGDFPGLVPVPGGSDAGIDGAIPDSEGEPFPLICTTAEDVERNLRDSLDSFAARFSAKKVALATSQDLTAPRRNRLFPLARERGFTLIQVIERRGIADRLHGNSRWRKELLDISGAPSALSVVPLTRRPLIGLEPIGREPDIRWVRGVDGDGVLVGEPGSGKTFLLYHLMREGWNGLFLVSAGEADIADAIRDQAPRVVVVDDAHADPGRLVYLVRLRREIGADFSILATTWAGGSERVIHALGVGGAQVRKLELLPRREILEIFEQVGVLAGADVLRQLVDQAANKPGLAVTIARLWLQGAWQEVLDGSVLRRTLLGFFGDFVGPQAMAVLAAFSLGGKEGMPLEVVREALGLELVEAYGIAAGLAAGGVLSEVNGEGEALAVWPRVLRSALIREVFFPQAGPRLPFEPLLRGAPSLESAVDALVLAKAYGATIPEQRLRAIVRQAGSRRSWAELAGLGEDEARWVLESYSGDLVDVARGALDAAPESTIPRLLERAATRRRPMRSSPASAMGLLANWVRAIEPADAEKLMRRRLLARLAADFLRCGGDRGVGVHGICLALSPGVEGTRIDPGAGNTMTISCGVLSVPQLREIEAIWEEVRTAIDEIDAASWQHLKSALWSWIHPQHEARSASLSEETTRVMHAFAAKVLRDLAPLAAGSPGLISGLRELAAMLGVTLALEGDPDFDVLFPPQGEGVDDEARGSAPAALERLVAEWVVVEPREVARKLATYEREAERAGRKWSSRKGAFGRALAGAVNEPEDWLAALMEAHANDLVIQPLLMRVARERREGWEHFLERALSRNEKRYAWIASGVTLQLEAPPVAILELGLEVVARAPQLVETLCSQREVPLPTLQTLLLHSDRSIALAAAVGEWHAGGRAGVRQEIAEAWRRAILGAPSGDRNVGLRFWLGVILAKNPDLAEDWLSARLREVGQLDGVSVSGDETFGRAVSALDRDGRKRLLGQPDAAYPQGLVRLLVGKDPEVYAHLLGQERLALRHLEPLGGNAPDGDWLDLTAQALAAGLQPRQIAEATVWGGSHSWAGAGVSYWTKWDQAFARFESHSREDIRAVAREGRRIARDEVKKANARQRASDLHGVGSERA